MNRKICIVEDTRELLENLTLFLSLEGYEVLPCTNGTEALEKLIVYKPDVIITDLWMPVMDGFTFIDTLKADPVLCNIPIVVFSAAPLQPKERELLDSKIDGFIIKPISMESFLDRIREFVTK